MKNHPLKITKNMVTGRVPAVSIPAMLIGLRLRCFALVTALACFAGNGGAHGAPALGPIEMRDAKSAPSASEFATPGRENRPFVLWYWVNGNVSQEGIRADLDGFVRAGLGGVYIINVGRMFIKGPVRFNTPDGIAMIKFAIREAAARGLRVNLYNGAGWSSSGGPWIMPEYGMQKLTWSEMQVTGGGVVDVVLKRPTVLKTYKPEFFEPEKPLDWYRDVAVVAFPTPAAEQMPEATAVISSNDPAFDAGKLNQDEPAPLVFESSRPFARLTTSAARAGFIQWSHDAPFAAQTLRLEFRASTSPAVNAGELLSSNDGATWKKVADFKFRSRGMPVHLPFVSDAARYWRVNFPQRAGTAELHLLTARLSAGYRIQDWSAKAMYDDVGMEKPPLPPLPLQAPRDAVVPLNSIVNLTGKMDGQGRLRWEAPPGKWTVIRFGHTPTGSVSSNPAHGGAGLDCDKFSQDAIDLQWRHAIGPYLEDPEVASHFQYVYIDSWEVEAQNWSKHFSKEFDHRRGYDPLLFLPAMTGRVVESLETSERFLWDVRTTICDLIDGYFGRVRELCAQNGKQFALEPYHQEQFNSSSAGTRADIPTCEVWYNENVTPAFWPKLGSSPAHVMGKPLVGCEAFTSNTRPAEGGDWSKDFADLKLQAHVMFCGGVNMMVFHVSAQQPWLNVAPGMTVGSCGQHFERTNPIWGQAGAFTAFVARSQYLLRRGRFVADVLYSCGENSPSKSLSPQGDLYPGAGYDYDVASPDVILQRLSVRDGRLVMPDGMNYRLLVLPESDTMSVAMINRLKELIQAGASVIAAKPSRAAGLASATEADAIIRARADEIWGPGIASSAGERHLGGGRVIWGKSVAKVLAGDRIIPDFSAPAKNARYPLLYIHRETDDGSDIYYVANTDWEKKSVRAEFRVTGKVPELWNPVTGEVRRLPEFEVRDQRTIVPLTFDARESFFVIFKSGSIAPSRSAKNFPALVPALELTGPWPVAFDPAWGGPAATVFDRLTDWSTCSEKGIKYYSGTAVYTRSFDFEAPASARRVYLDLGVVRNVASVRLNGKSAGTVWSAPYRLDITGLLKPAGNQLVIEVTNLMPNRMIGDEQLPADYRLNANHTLAEIPEWLAQNRPRTSGRYTFASFNPYTKDSPLLPSGLLGPVFLQYEPDGDAAQFPKSGARTSAMR